MYEGSLERNDLLLSICSTLPDEISECKDIDLSSGEGVKTFEIVMFDLLILAIGVLLLTVVCKRIAKKKYERYYYKDS